jgi:predicted MFS family arabinose efflux permease
VGIFRAIWIASLASNLCTWMHMIAASWLMTSLTASAALVALVQTAIAFPMFLLALPAGALADIFDRRRMLILTQGWQLLVAATLGLMTLADATTPASLLALTLALGMGAALGLPVFLAIIPELVPRAQLPSAVSLNSVSLTLAQALGPTLGGLLVASLGAGAVFLLNAVSFVAIAGVVAAWHRIPPVSTLPPEHVGEAIRAGLRYVRNAPPLQIVLFRVVTHVLFFSALPALLVVVTRTRLDLGAGGYGALFGCFGAGGAAGALLLPWVRGRVAIDRLVPLAGVAFAASLVALAILRTAGPLYPMMALAGVGSMTVISSLSVATQSVLPEWVRGRGLAVYVLTFQVGLATGAALWGALAANLSVSAALLIAASGMAALHVLSGLAGLKLAVAEGVEPTPAPWSEPGFVLQPEPGDGPVRIEIEYRIAGEDTADFLAAMREVRRTRRRDGAMQWSLFQDLSDPERHVESFLVRSWAEHERGRERAVRSDRAAIERVLALHRGDGPRVTHLLGHHFRGREPPPPPLTAATPFE